MSGRRSSRVVKTPRRFRDDFETQEDDEKPASWEESKDHLSSSLGGGRGSSEDAEGDVDAVRDRSRSPNHLGCKIKIEHDDIVPQPPCFTPKRTPGIQPPLNMGNPQPVEFFSHFFDAATLKLLCENTNKNAVKNKQKGKKFAWKDATPEEMTKFLGMLLYMAVLHLPKLSDFWRKGTIFQVGFPGRVMTRDRFMAVLTNLHMSDPDEDERNEQKRGTDDYDLLHQVRPLLEMIRLKCKSIYHPRQHLAVDERMVATKARCMMAKPTKWRLKFYVLADLNGYNIDFNLYTGKSKDSSGKGLFFDVVNDLFNKDYLGSGYVVNTDNFHTSPLVFSHLSQQGFEACGTYGQGSVGVPIKQENAITMCSTIHPVYSGDTVEHWQKTGDGRRKASEYSKLDASDQMIGTHTIYRRTTRWSTTVFQHLVDIAVTNSYVLHKDRCASMETKPMTRQQFQEELAAQLLGVSLHTETPKTSGQHLPFPTSSGQSKTQRASMGRRRCKVCKKSTAWKCEECDIGLCLQLDRNCFWQYHKD